MARSKSRETPAQRIRRLRLAAGLTQGTVAERALIHRVTLAEIEGGRSDPQLSTLQRIAAAIGVPLAKLLG